MALRRRCSSGANLPYPLNPGDGAFYGPKIDLHMTDSLGPLLAAGHGPARLQLARALRLQLHRRRQRRAPAVMIHRALFGSFERFIGILTEHYAAPSPLWIPPLQVPLIPSARPIARRRNRWRRARLPGRCRRLRRERRQEDREADAGGDAVYGRLPRGRKRRVPGATVRGSTSGGHPACRSATRSGRSA